MAKTVSEIMNHELFTVRATETVDDCLQNLVSFGITAAPVVDESGKPLGVISLRDLITAEDRNAVFSRMTSPATIVQDTDTIEHAAARMAESDHHHVVVTDEHCSVVGFVGALDAVRGLLGKPTPHPAAFPHYDPDTKLTWSDDLPLALGSVDQAPEQPGLYLLIHGAAGQPDRIVWSEATRDLHERLSELVVTPNTAPPHLQHWITQDELRFRTAVVPSAKALLAKIRELNSG